MKRLVLISLAAAGLAGCGTITRGSTESVAFQSEPPGAQVTTSLGSGCPTTPCTIEISRSQEFNATFSLPGHHSDTVPVKTVVSGTGGASMAGNLLFGGLIGAGVDTYNGTALNHSPNPVVGRLRPISSPIRRPTIRRSKPAAAPAT